MQHQAQSPSLAHQVLTRTGAGTLMGEYFRRFWLPIALSQELRAEVWMAVANGAKGIATGRAGKPFLGGNGAPVAHAVTIQVSVSQIGER